MELGGILLHGGYVAVVGDGRRVVEGGSVPEQTGGLRREICMEQDERRRRRGSERRQGTVGAESVEDFRTGFDQDLDVTAGAVVHRRRTQPLFSLVQKTFKFRCFDVHTRGIDKHPLQHFPSGPQEEDAAQQNQDGTQILPQVGIIVDFGLDGNCGRFSEANFSDGSHRQGVDLVLPQTADGHGFIPRLCHRYAEQIWKQTQARNSDC